MDEFKLADESKFEPLALQKLLEKIENGGAQNEDLSALNRGLQRTTNQMDKKRVYADFKQRKLYERTSEVSRQTASKTKQTEISSQPV